MVCCKFYVHNFISMSKFDIYSKSRKDVKMQVEQKKGIQKSVFDEKWLWQLAP